MHSFVLTFYFFNLVIIVVVVVTIEWRAQGEIEETWRNGREESVCRAS